MNHYNEQEVWKDIPGYEGLYQASTLGQIKSLNYLRTGKAKNLKVQPCGKHLQYFFVSLSIKGNNKYILVHQLIAMTFLDHIRDGHKLVIDHIDCDTKNNKLSNLKIVTSKENLNKEKNINSKLPSGINFSRKGFSAKIHLGWFKTVEEASAAYQSALTKINNNGI